MNRIEIRGVIVPSNWDLSWTQEYIAKGIITPESYVRKAIKAAPGDKAMELYINSPGGSVFAAYEIINALAAWKAEHKQAVNITIGAMAASAASAISILSGATVAVHRNSKLMFHGAWTETIGGAEAHKDTETLLNQINADIKTQLVSRHGVPVAVVDEWFAEGRMGWLTAQDAMKYKIASNIVDADDEEIKFADADVAGIEANGLAIAALVKPPKDDGVAAEKAKEGKDDARTEPVEVVAAKDGVESPASEPAPVAAATPAPRNIEAEIAARVELAIGSRLEQHNAAMTALKAQLAATETERRKAQGERDANIAAHAKETKHFEEQLAATRVALEQANARLVKLTLGSLTYSAAIETWPEALAACGGDYATARRQYPEAYQTYMNQKKKGS